MPIRYPNSASSSGFAIVQVVKDASGIPISDIRDSLLCYAGFFSVKSLMEDEFACYLSEPSYALPEEMLIKIQIKIGIKVWQECMSSESIAGSDEYRFL